MNNSDIKQYDFDALNPMKMAQKAEEVGVYKATKSPFATFLLAITAGVFISIAFVFYITVTSGAESAPWGLVHFAGGLAFTLGLILVVVCGAELFTSSVLSIVSKASRKISWIQLLRHWIIVYFGNMVGALFFVILIWLAGQHMANKGDWGVSAMQIAQHKLHHTFIQAVVLGALCNLMVCLAIWMTFSARSVADKVVVMLLPISMFVASGFEHSIANMFMIPMGIVIKTFASPEFWTMTGLNPSSFSDLTIHNFIFNNLIPVTIGNIIGGAVLVGLTYWVLYLRKSK